MTTLSFKISEEEARKVRSRARRAGLSLSEYVRQRLGGASEKTRMVRHVKCRLTGAVIFAPAPKLPPLTTQAVKEMLADFP